MTWTWIMQTTPTELFHTSLWFIPDMLDTASEMLTTPAMIIVLIIWLFVWFLISISK